MYSLKWSVGVLGEPLMADRLELIAFNAFPAAFSPDIWVHQYDQQVNQIECTIRVNRSWSTNGPDANIYGLETNYGCCTANLSQGWPTFVAYLGMRTRTRPPGAGRETGARQGRWDRALQRRSKTPAVH